MTPKEASIEIQLIRQQLQRLVRINGITPADYTTIQDACVNIVESLNSLSSFIAQLRTKAKPRHPPNVPVVPERKTNSECGAYPPPITVDLFDTEREYAGPPERYTEALASIRKAVRDIEYAPHVKSTKSISGGARPPGRLE